MMDPYTCLTAGTMLLNSLLLIGNTADNRSERIRLWWWRNMYGSSILTISFNLQQLDLRTVFHHWISFIKLSLLYKQHYPKGQSMENMLTISDDLMYLLLYAPNHIRDEFWSFTDPKDPMSYVPKRTRFYLPAGEFKIPSKSRALKNGKMATVDLVVSCHIERGIPLAIRTMTSQWFWGWGWNSLSRSEAKIAQQETMEDLQDFLGLDSLIADIIYKTPNNTRFMNYLTQKTKNIIQLQGHGNPHPMNAPLVKVSEDPGPVGTGKGPVGTGAGPVGAEGPMGTGPVGAEGPMGTGVRIERSEPIPIRSPTITKELLPSVPTESPSGSTTTELLPSVPTMSPAFAPATELRQRRTTQSVAVTSTISNSDVGAISMHHGI
jgi:hypothetical protein